MIKKKYFNFKSKSNNYLISCCI